MEVVGVGSSHAEGAKFECLLFDLDDTLYPLSIGLNLACRKNIQEFMLNQLGIEETEVPRMCMCLELYREYATTMAGLKDLGYEFDDDEFHAYVHGKLPYDALKPDPLLRNLLLSMPQRKIIFTNADKAHASQVLSRLEDCFEGVICFETLNPVPPPPVASSADHGSGVVADDNMVVTGESKEADHGSGVVADDNMVVTGESKEALISVYATNDETKSNAINSKANQQILCKPSLAAMQAAIRIANLDPNKTVGSSNFVPGADHALSSIHNIKEALPQIWEGEEERLDQIIQDGVETVVLA